MNIAYVRVSTVEQNEQRQIEAMKPFNIEKWFIEKISAKDTNRPKLQELLEFAREGDTIHVHEMKFIYKKQSPKKLPSYSCL